MNCIGTRAVRDWRDDSSGSRLGRTEIERGSASRGW